MTRAQLAAFVGAVVAGTAAHADPCKAIPDKGPMPAYLRPEARFSGPVVYIGDGDSLCVAVGAGVDRWVEVRIDDFYAPELREPGGTAAKATLERIAMGKRIVCVASHRSHDRVVAKCKLDGVSLGARMRAAGAAEGGNGH